MWIVVILAADYKPSDTKQVIVAAEMMLNCLGETDTSKLHTAKLASKALGPLVVKVMNRNSDIKPQARVVVKK